MSHSSSPGSTIELKNLLSQLDEANVDLQLLSKEGYCKLLCRNYTYIVENAPISVIITRADGLIEYVNPQFEELTGYTLAEVVGKNPNILSSGETSGEDYKALWDTLLRGEQWTGTFHNRRKNGEYFWERALISAIKDDTGNVTHFIGLKEDITAVKEAEARLEQEQLKTIHNSKMAEIGILASGILHEIGNPIAAVRGLLCDIKDTCQDFENHETLNQMIDQQLDIILGEIDRITGIARDLSEFTYSNRLESELLNLNEIVGMTCRLIKFDSRFKSIKLKVNLATQLPAINGHKDQLTQVLFNLLSNAAHAVDMVKHRTSEITVSTIVDGQSIYLTVIDNGCGIENAKLPVLFETFFTDKKPGEGSGLGLTLSKSIVENHLGNISINSDVDHGTEVRVELPIEERT